MLAGINPMLYAYAVATFPQRELRPLGAQSPEQDQRPGVPAFLYERLPISVIL